MVLDAILTPSTSFNEKCAKLVNQFKEANNQVGLLLLQKVESFINQHPDICEDFEEVFTYDVVYGLDSLCVAFNIPDGNDAIRQSHLESIIGLTIHNTASISFQNYIVWNAREQEFQLIYGIQNAQLRLMTEATLSDPKPYQKALLSYLHNAFSMCNRDGNEVSLVDLHAYRGFWPEFYPRRFKLKDSLYQQRLDILAYLLQHCLKRYSSCDPPVKYVEFSVGTNDLSRKWIFEVLTWNGMKLRNNKEDYTNSFSNLVEEAQKHEFLKYLEKSDVEYHFLAGFDRGKTEYKRIADDSPVNILICNGDAASYYFTKELGVIGNHSSLFQQHIALLMRLAKSFNIENYAQSNSINNKRFNYWIVGFDLFGDELGFPYCPFVT